MKHAQLLMETGDTDFNEHSDLDVWNGQDALSGGDTAGPAARQEVLRCLQDDDQDGRGVRVVLSAFREHMSDRMEEVDWIRRWQSRRPTLTGAVRGVGEGNEEVRRGDETLLRPTVKRSWSEW